MKTSEAFPLDTWLRLIAKAASQFYGGPSSATPSGTNAEIPANYKNPKKMKVTEKE
jgi:hypothetical protein